MDFPLFVKTVLQDGLGIDANEFLSKGAIEGVDVGSMNAEAVVHLGVMTDAFGVNAIGGEHRVQHRENERGTRRCHPLASSSRSKVDRMRAPIGGAGRCRTNNREKFGVAAHYLFVGVAGREVGEYVFSFGG
jgi:hypothetical protein